MQVHRTAGPGAQVMPLCLSLCFTLMSSCRAVSSRAIQVAAGRDSLYQVGCKTVRMFAAPLPWPVNCDLMEGDRSSCSGKWRSSGWVPALDSLPSLPTIQQLQRAFMPPLPGALGAGGCAHHPAPHAAQAPAAHSHARSPPSRSEPLTHGWDV